MHCCERPLSKKESVKRWGVEGRPYVSRTASKWLFESAPKRAVAIAWP